VKAYFISGIGADYRLFKNIHLPYGFEAEYLHWIPPLKDESIREYASRLAQNINRDEQHILIGLSLGGIMATEIAKLTSPVSTIIFGSIPTHKQLPPWFKYAAKIKLHRLIHPSLVKLSAAIKHSLFTKGQENRRFLRQLIRDGDNRFIYWGMDAVMKWRNEDVPASLIHIHGSNDEVFPIRYVKPAYVLKGGHLLVFHHANEVNKLLEEILTREE
jgi:pimeloyl-ACP methyl ester carboxylesterase